MAFYKCVKRYFYKDRIFNEGDMLSTNDNVDDDPHFQRISAKAAASPEEPPVPELPQSMSEMSSVKAPRKDRVFVAPDEITKIKPKKAPGKPKTHKM